MKKTINQIQEANIEIKHFYHKGDLSLLGFKKIAIVGSRKAYPHTKHAVHQLALNIARAGGVIVSGGAMGVDCVAHSSAMPRTIGVFANSLDLYCPRTCKNTIDDIYNRGLALSEHEQNISPRRGYFLRRNQIIVAMSDVVVVAQADLRSGSMHSAQYAISQKKPLFVLPNRMGESEGTNYLLAQNKARAIYDIDEFLTQIGFSGANRDDVFLQECLKNPDYEILSERFAQELFEYELLGKIKIENSKVVVL